MRDGKLPYASGLQASMLDVLFTDHLPELREQLQLLADKHTRKAGKTAKIRITT
jgi:hypothetical protein